LRRLNLCGAFAENLVSTSGKALLEAGIVIEENWNSWRAGGKMWQALQDIEREEFVVWLGG
jgi:hypothetical protein